jgi:hypothetical protein
VKQAVSKPPEVSRKAPTKPPPVVVHSPPPVAAVPPNNNNNNPPQATTIPPPVAPVPVQPQQQPQKPLTLQSPTPPVVNPVDSKPQENESSAVNKTNLSEEKKTQDTLSRAANFAKRDSDRIIDLEEEVQELKRKLERAEARLVRVWKLTFKLFFSFSLCFIILDSEGRKCWSHGTRSGLRTGIRRGWLIILHSYFPL